MASFTSLLTTMASPLTKPSRTSLPSPSPSLRPRQAMTVECSSRPQKKATAHHAKTRPKKHALWDKKRRPTDYPPLPPFPPEWTLVEPAAAAAGEESSAPAE